MRVDRHTHTHLGTLITIIITIMEEFIVRLLQGEHRCITRVINSNQQTLKAKLTRMWANAQRDGRPAEYRWCPLFNAAKFG